MFDTRPEVAAELDTELVAWLTTVTKTGRPQTSVVWFLRRGQELLVYSQAHARKLDNLSANPQVSFNLRGDAQGDRIATFEGTATVDRSPSPAHEDPEYLAKYEGEITRLGWTPPEFAAEYPVLIRIQLDRVRSWQD
jgi:PPOX class probable F420-dependent enzyme